MDNQAAGVSGQTASMKDLTYLVGAGVSSATLEACQGLADMVLDHLGVQSTMRSGGQGALLQEVLSGVTDEKRREAFSLRVGLTRGVAKKTLCCQVAAAAELLGLTDQVVFDAFKQFRCGQIGETWTDLLRKDDNRGPTAELQLRASLWLWNSSAKTGGRSQDSVLTALEAAIPLYLSADGDRRDKLRALAINYIDPPAPTATEPPASLPTGQRNTTTTPVNQWWRNRQAQVVLAVAAIVVILVSLVVYSWRRPIKVQVEPKIIVPAPTAGQGQTGAAPIRAKFDNSHGWGPARKTYTDQLPPAHPIWNSITNSSWWAAGADGDERQFLSCWDKTKSGTVRDNEVVADDGHVYGCFASFSNDISKNIDEAIQGAKIAVSLPRSSMYNPGIVAFLSGTNAPEVWASCNFVSPRPMRVIYQYGSARMYTKGTPTGGLQLAETRQGNSITNGIVTKSGALLGYGKQDGIVRYSYKYSGYIVFDVKVALDPPQ